MVRERRHPMLYDPNNPNNPNNWQQYPQYPQGGLQQSPGQAAQGDYPPQYPQQGGIAPSPAQTPRTPPPRRRTRPVTGRQENYEPFMPQGFPPQNPYRPQRKPVQRRTSPRQYSTRSLPMPQQYPQRQWTFGDCVIWAVIGGLIGNMIFFFVK